jgi:hypothetical protein
MESFNSPPRLYSILRQDTEERFPNQFHTRFIPIKEILAPSPEEALLLAKRAYPFIKNRLAVEEKQ